MGERDGYHRFSFDALNDVSLDALATLTDAAWRADYRGVSRVNFDQTYLARLMSGKDWIAVAVVAPNDDLVGFELGVGRTLKTPMGQYDATYVTAFSVAPDHRRRGLGGWVLEGINERVFQSAGNDLIFSTFHSGHAGSPTVQSTYDAANLAVNRFHSTPLWVRRLNREPLPPMPDVEFHRLIDRAPDAAGDRNMPVRRLGDAIPTFLDPYSAHFRFDRGFRESYLSASDERSGTIWLGSPETGLGVIYSLLPCATDDSPTYLIGLVHAVLSPPGTEVTIKSALAFMMQFFAERECIAILTVDLGAYSSTVLSDLGFAHEEDTISFAVRGSEPLVRAINVEPPFFLDFI
ncbi:MAG: hypothetical protein AAF493_22190 [Pseudomonadota bacterium]